MMIDKVAFISNMIVHTPASEQADSILCSSQEEIRNSFFIRIQDYTSVEFALLVSIVSLCMASVLKYFISNQSSGKEWWLFSLELPIDLCLVILTLIATIYIKNHVALGVIFLLLTILVISICCITRRNAMKYYYRTEKNSGYKTFGFSILTILLSVLFCSVIIYVIS